MCHSDESRPPAPPIRTGVGRSGTIELAAADGARVLAHEAVPSVPTGAGIVIMPDVRGLHAFYRTLAEGFADAGLQAVAVDYFGRTAADDVRDETFDFREHLGATSLATVTQDVAAGVGRLRAAGVTAVFTVGFCFGGSSSWAQSAAGLDLAGCIGFYGGKPLDRAGAVIEQMTAPLLMLLAGIDSTTPEEFQTFADRVRAVGVSVESHTYPGAPHSFFDRSFDEHRAACDDAWVRMLAFIEARTPAPSTS